jgi:hypothetical protein
MVLTMSSAIDRCAVRGFIRTRQQNFAPTRVLNPEAEKASLEEREMVRKFLAEIFDSIAPDLPDQPSVAYEIHLVDDIDVAQTQTVSDGGQLILISRQYLMFLRNLVEAVSSGVTISDEGMAVVTLRVTEDESKKFGRNLGEYLEIGTPLTFPPRESRDFGPEVLVAAMEFVITHEVTHRIEAHTAGPDLELTGFQDFCRLRGREYFCDQRAVSLLLHRRRDTKMPEVAFAGAVIALLAISWLEQFTPGYIPGGDRALFHPGTDSRLLRILLEQPLYWSAVKLGGSQSNLADAMVRRAFRLMRTFEHEPKYISSPLNELVRRCTESGEPDHDFFDRQCGMLFARGRVERIADALGALWGSAENPVEGEDDGGSSAFLAATVALLTSMHSRLAKGDFGAAMVADAIASAKSFRMEHPDVI